MIMTRMNKENLKEQVVLLHIVEKLHELGLTWDKAEDFPFATPRIWSEYSMGEEILYCFQNSPIFKEDYTQQYAKSCQWRAKHGYIVINFKTKKALKEFADKAISGKITYEDIDKNINWEVSHIKGNKFSFKNKKEEVKHNLI